MIYKDSIMTPEAGKQITEARHAHTSRLKDAIKRRRNRVLGTLVTLAPVALGIATTSAYTANSGEGGSGGSGGSGTPSSISLVWGGQRDTMPSSYNRPV